MPYKGKEKRRYIRLNSVFPVEFSLIFIDGRAPSKKYQAFTHDISRGGLCIRVRDLEPADAEALLQKEAKLRLSINTSTPLFAKPIYATCNIAWVEQAKKDASGTLCPPGTSYNIGVAYEQILPKHRNQIINYARRLKWEPRITAAVVILLILGLFGAYIYQDRIKKQNIALVSRLVEISERRNDIFQKLNNLKQTKIFLEKKLFLSTEKIEKLASSLRKSETSPRKTGEAISAEEIILLKKKLEELHSQNANLKKRIATITEGEVLLEKQLADITTESNTVEQANIQKMRDWISVHRNRRTGLVLSYEGDKTYEDWSFTYDQALAVHAFLLFNDIEKASGILDFYKDRAKRQNGLFYNAYDSQTGKPIEYTVHSGPNLWIAMAVSKYTKYTNNNKYLKLAENIADIMISMQNESEDGGIKGGPKVTWVSTEHNMDAYALFNMLYELTKDEKYRRAKETAFSWLKLSAYNKPQGRFNRGRGDATIATDTFSWAIASAGPQLLKENGMDPDGIMEFAEKECRVKAQFYRPDGTSTEVIGFDFAKAAHLGRGGIVSCEWTAQMVVAFKIMANYHRARGDIEKSSIYSEKAKYYLNQLSKMVVSSPSPSGQGEGCLPYASIDNVDTGHGWRVAKGRRTGSVAATIYYIFAQRGYNPLKS